MVMLSAAALSADAELCEHLAPLRRALREAGVAIGFGSPCPFGREFGIWFRVDCTFDHLSLRHRLDLDPCVEYEDFEHVLTADADAHFYCTCCHKAIAGHHPRYAGRNTTRLR